MQVTSATVTHAGMAVLVAGALLSWLMSYSGEVQVPTGATAPVRGANWKLRVDESWREDYISGEPKQWFTRASVIGDRGEVIRKQTISVNAPMSFDGMDIYQAGWGPHEVEVSFNGHKERICLKPMGQTSVGGLEIAPEVALMLSVRKQDSPMSVYVRTRTATTPHLVATLPAGEELTMGSVSMKYEKFLPSTLLRYKRDPGIPIVYLGFALVTAGVCLGALPKNRRAQEVKIA